MPYLQEVIQKLEGGPWMRHVKTGVAVLALVGLVLGYNWRSFRNFGTQEAMDSAQLARNLEQGKGYTTLFVRPLSVYLVKQRNGAEAAASKDPARLRESHPDLANPPVYPFLLAGWMKVYPLVFKAADAGRSILPNFIEGKLPRFDLAMDNQLWQKDRNFWWSPHDFMIAILNELILFSVICLTFLLARHLFDPGVAWLSAILLLGCELLWRFSTAGLSTMLLMLIFLALAWALVLVEQEAREPKGGYRKLFLFGAATGLLLGVGMLTRYSFGWLLLPVGVYLILFGGSRKAALCLVTLATFLMAVSPWIYRNVKLSGMPFGTATFAILESPFVFAEHRLARSLTPDFKQNYFHALQAKLFRNGRTVIQNELPKLGGSWLTPLFLAGLLLGFRNPAIRRLRYFLMMSLATLIVVQALGRTQLTDDSPELNSENLLVLLVPLVFVFGVGLFYLMLDQMNLPFPGLRPIVVGVFGVVMILPMVFTFLPPKPNPIVYPPYSPPAIQRISSWMNESELMMSDVPWAVAWYGQRQCIWLTLKTGLDLATGQTSDKGETFYAVNDWLKPVGALYLTQETLDTPYITQWVNSSHHSWQTFLHVGIIVRKEIHPRFPLRAAAPGFLQGGQLFLSDRVRWAVETSIRPSPAKPATTEKMSE